MARRQTQRHGRRNRRRGGASDEVTKILKKRFPNGSKLLEYINMPDEQDRATFQVRNRDQIAREVRALNPAERDVVEIEVPSTKKSPAFKISSPEIVYDPSYRKNGTLRKGNQLAEQARAAFASDDASPKDVGLPPPEANKNVGLQTVNEADEDGGLQTVNEANKDGGRRRRKTRRTRRGRKTRGRR